MKVCNIKKDLKYYEFSEDRKQAMKEMHGKGWRNLFEKQIKKGQHTLEEY